MLIVVIFEVQPAEGRGGVFDDYRLRVAHVIRNYGMFVRTKAPEDSKKAHS